MKKRHYKLLLHLSFICFVIAMISNYSYISAATDKKKPTVTAKPASENPTSRKVKVTIKATDASGIQIVKWAVGSKSANYFQKSGAKLTLNSKDTTSIVISKNGLYSIYAKDKAGNVTIKKVTITNIDTSKPTVTVKKSTLKVTNKNVKIGLTIAEIGSGITSVKYLTGRKVAADFANAGKDVKFTQTTVVEDKYGNNQYQYSAILSVNSNNLYTFLIEDAAGNQLIKRANIANIDKTAPLLTYAPNTTKPTNKAVTVKITATDEGFGLKNVTYLAGKKTLEDFTDPNQSAIIIKLNENGLGSFKTTKNGNFTVLVTDTAGNKTLQVIALSNIDTLAPTISLNYTVMNQSATITTLAEDKKSGISSIKYVKGKVTDTKDTKWNETAKDITNTGSFKTSSAGNYSVLATDAAGNQSIGVIYVELEMRAVWISYLEFLAFTKNGCTEAVFKEKINTMFDNVVDLKMNAVVVQVRPFGDAMYPSSYFPWSKYASGTQGVNPGYDPLKYMVEAAHERGLEFHAWLNPYRVTLSNTNYSSLSEDNPARVWQEDNDTSNDRNVLSFGGNLYYNPASKEVQTLITNGIIEIVNNYDVDGIHFDDYFYPAIGSGHASKFDSKEYDQYAKNCKDQGKTPLTIPVWRRNNVNTLVKNVYQSIKSIDPTVQFGISPGGFYDSLTSDVSYYVDYKTWLSSDGYIDYICPQIYWTFKNKTYPYDKTLDKWLSFRTNENVKMYVGIATYRAGSNISSDWKDDDEVLKDQIEYGRDTGLVDGFMFFRYDFFYNKVTKPSVDKLLKIL